MSEYLQDPVSRANSLTELIEDLHRILQCMDRIPGYYGKERLVAFYHEPRALEVVWMDRHAHGFAIGGWTTFMDEVAPIATHYGANVGCQGTAATHVLLVNRSGGKAYFCERTQVVQYFARLANEEPDPDRESAGQADDLDSMREITSEEITRFARQLWEEKSGMPSEFPDCPRESVHPGISIAAAIHMP